MSEIREIIGNTTATPVPQADWNQDKDFKPDYIKNKPTLGTLASKDEVALSDLATDVKEAIDKANGAMQPYTETDPTVPSWAKASSKPTYTATEVGAAPSSHTHSASDIAKAGYLATHPESATSTLVPFINNDLAFLTLKGGSINAYTTTSTDLTAENLEQGELNLSGADKLFNGTPSVAYLMTDGNYVAVIDLVLHKTFTWSNNFYIDFGLPDFRAKNIAVYVMNKDTETAYTLKNSITNNSASYFFCTIEHDSKNSGGATVRGFNKLRIVLSDFRQSGSSYGRRLAEIGLVNYSSAGATEVFVSRGGCDGIYGNLIPHTNSNINLGSSAKKWNNIYGTNIYQNGKQVANKEDISQSVVHIGTDTPPEQANVWINPDGEPTGTENWEFDLDDGRTETKTVVIIGADEANGRVAAIKFKQDDGTWAEFPTIKGDRGEQGEQGIQGIQGEQGPDGKSAYEYAKEGGYTGNEGEFATKLATEYLPLAGGTMSGDLIFSYGKIIKMKNSSGTAIDVLSSASSVGNLIIGNSNFLSLVSYNSIVPANAVSKTADLGSSSSFWRDLYLSGNLSDGTNSIAVKDIAKKNDVPSKTENWTFTLKDGRTVTKVVYVG